MSGPGVSKYADRQIWLPFVNGTDKTIPAMSCVRITGKEKSSGGRTVPEAQLTDAEYGFGAQFLHRITYEKDVEPGATGHFCYPMMAPVLAAFETSDGQPSPATMWGPIGDGEKLRANVGGYRVIGKPVKGSRNSYAVLVMAEPLLSFEGNLVEELVHLGEALCVCEGTNSDEAFQFLVAEVMGIVEPIAAETKVWVQWSHRRNKFAVIAAACGGPVEASETEE